MEEIKKRFDEYFKGNIDENSYLHINTVYIRNFIQSEIDLAVSKERERIVEIIDKSQGYECVLPEIDPSLGELTSRDIDFVKSKYGQIVFKKELINLINTK